MEKLRRARPDLADPAPESLETGAAEPSRRRRRRLNLWLSALFCAAAVVYITCFHLLRFPARPGVHVDASDEAYWSAADVDDAYVLHPEDHIHREARTIYLAWNVTRATCAPDGVSKTLYLINGQFPGPLIEARSGDELVVSVRNAIHDHGEGVSMHWHGLFMKGANEMDGAVGLTQCAIGPGQVFTYRFRIDEQQSGTFWYHAHSGVQRADGLYGGLVVHQPVSERDSHALPAPRYEAEQLLLVGDWYHRPADDVLDWFMDPDHYGYEPAPDSMLFNGRGSYDCSMAVKAWPVNCSAVAKPTVTLAGRDRVRLRVVNTGITAGLTLALTHGSMKLLAVDGGGKVSPDTPAAAAVGVLYPGERMDVIVDRRVSVVTSSGNVENQVDNDEPWLMMALDKENMNLKNFALTRKQSFPVTWKLDEDAAHSSHVQPESEAAVSHLDLGDASGPALNPSLSGPMARPQETAVLYTTMLMRAANHNSPVGTVNHTSWAVSDPKARPLLALDRARWSSAVPQPTSAQTLKVPWFREAGPGRWLELVINNFDDKGHPFHMHGYVFFVVARRHAQAGQPVGYNPHDPAAVARAQPVNVANPLLKDTVHVPAQGHVVLRFPLDKEGLWLLHCHVLWHQAAGMGIVLQVGEVQTGTGRRAAALCAT